MAKSTGSREREPTWLGSEALRTANAPAGATTAGRVEDVAPGADVLWAQSSRQALLPPGTALRLWLRKGTTQLDAPEGRRALTARRVAIEWARWLGFRCWAAAWIAVGWSLQRLFGQPTADRGTNRVAAGRPATPGFVLPVLPDLSHTFVYRELLAVLEQRPETRVYSLRSDPTAPVHAEAAALLDRARGFPAGGVWRMFWSMTRALLRSPRRVGHVFALHHHAPDSSIRLLLNKAALTDPAHPGRAFALAEWLRREPLGHLHVYGSTYPANAVMTAALLTNTPFSISSYVDFDFRYDHRMLADKFALAEFFRVENHACHKSFVERVADAVHWTAPHLDPGQDRVPVIYYGLDLERWQDRARPAGAGLMVSASRLVEKKGLHLMPAALRQLQARGIPCRWVVFGDGPMRQSIVEAIAKHGVEDLVELRGAQPNHAVREQLMTADLAVLPCLIAKDGERDGIPNFLTEAMALEVPIVTTPVSGIPEIIRDDESGFLTGPGDVDALVETLTRVLRSPELRAQVGAGGRAEVQRSRDCRRNARALLHRLDPDTGRSSG